MTTINEAYINLQAAIIEQAIEDYETAIFYGYRYEKSELKRWFSSKWAQFLTNDNGELIEQRVSKYMKKIKSMTKIVDECIVTTIKATDSIRAKLDGQLCTYRVNDDGCLIFKKYRSFKKSMKALRLM